MSKRIQNSQHVESLEARRLLSAAAVSALMGEYGQVPLSFEQNRGQIDAGADFLARGNGYSLFLSDGGKATLSLQAGGQRDDARVAAAAQSVVLGMRLLGGDQDAVPTGQRELPGKVNSFIGDASKWRTNIPTFGSVKYDDVYRGIDLIYYGTSQRQLEYDFVVDPGADPNAIRLAFDGADRTQLDASGELILHTAGSSVRLAAPVSYQNINGRRVEVNSAYVLGAGGEVRIEVGRYDASQTLVIDPVLSYSTYLGGTGFDVGYGIAVDSAGSAYVTGRTGTSNFPTTPGAFQTTTQGANNLAFVTKFTPDGTGVVYSTYLGGGFLSHTHGYAIKVDAEGNAYVTGETSSNDFPVTPGAYSTPPYDWDAFVTKLNPTGSALIWSTRIGGEFADYARDLDIDAQGNVYITGETYNWGGGARLYPTTPGSFKPSSASRSLIAFVTKINADGASLAYSSFHGGNDNNGTESGWGIAVDPTGAAYITGDTTGLDYPLVNPFDTTLGGARDAYVAKINPAGSALVYSTYLGGTFSDIGGRDFGRAIEVDATGHAYVTGWTDTFNLDFTPQNDGFPTTPNAFQPHASGYASGTLDGMFEDAFVTKFSPAGNTLVYSTYLGGRHLEGQGDIGYDQAWDIAIDSQGYAYIVGRANSLEFPVHRPLPGQEAFHGWWDGFITKLGPDGSSLAFSSFIGTSNFDEAWGVAVDGAGNAYVVGSTTSENFPVTPGAFQPNNGGADVHRDDAFVMKIQSSDESRVGIRNITSVPDTVPAGQPAQITVTLHGPAPVGGITVELSSGRPEIASIPPSVFIPEGQTSVTFATLTTQQPPQWNFSAATILVARLDGAVRYETLTVNPAPLNAAATLFNINGNGSGPAVRITFNKDVVASSITASDLRLVDAVTGQNTGINAASVSFDPVARAATWLYSGALPDGRYRAVLPAGSVTAQSGETLAADVNVAFHALGGDANRDRRVNLDDFNILASNFGQSNRVFTQGDFNYDGVVNLEDFNILASRFGGSVGPAAGSPARGGAGEETNKLPDDLDDLLA